MNILFFGGPSHESFFKPNIAIQRKCDHCAAEEKTIKRMGVAEEEKKVQKMDEKKEEDKTVHKMDAKEEEKKVQKTGDKKEEEKSVQKMGDTKQEEKKLDKKDAGVPATGISATGAFIKTLSGKGQPLPGETRQFFQKRMGHDFGNVKIHTGSDAEKSAKDINAKAYAVDNHIVFNKGQYNPRSAEGKKLLAHELTHIVQQEGNENGLLNRVAQLNEKRQEEEKPVLIQGVSTKTKNKTAHGCGGVEVHGQTDANYKSSFKTSGKSRTSEACTDCMPPDCITSQGVVISSFKANPVITLPDVPDGLTKCEAKAVKKFINGTLKRHEQQHQKAFKTYDGTVRTPYNFTGCSAELNTHVQSIHDGVEAQRAADANALSDAIDPFNATIPCNCKD